MIFSVQLLFASVSAQASEISYETFLKWREDPNTIVLDAAELEPLFFVVPEAVLEKTGRGVTQAELDTALQTLIPSRDTRVILYCWQNFAPTRTVLARTSVALHLRGNGYSNVHQLKDLWLKKSVWGEAEILDREELEPRTKEVVSSAKEIPGSVRTLIERGLAKPQNE